MSDNPDTMNTISSALSGMNAASLQLATSAHNIANALTPGFQRQSVARQTALGGGVSAEVVQAGATGESLAADIVTQMSASYAFKANLKLLKTQDEVLGSLLDLKA